MLYLVKNHEVLATGICSMEFLVLYNLSSLIDENRKKNSYVISQSHNQ
jgi:hypothetical protein